MSHRLMAGGQPGLFTLQIAGVSETVKVAAPARYNVPVVSSATKTDTPLRDVPQRHRHLPQAIRDLSMQSCRRAALRAGRRHCAGRGQPRHAGASRPVTTSDLFVDGLRDDAQYYRDLYNVDRVEVLSGPMR